MRAPLQLLLICLIVYMLAEDLQLLTTTTLGMPTIDEEIAAVTAKISSLEDEIAAAKMKGYSEAYIINLGEQMVELRKEKNLLLAKSLQIGTEGEIADIRRKHQYNEDTSKHSKENYSKSSSSAISPSTRPHGLSLPSSRSFTEKYPKSLGHKNGTNDPKEFDFETAWKAEVARDRMRDEQDQLYGKPIPSCHLVDAIDAKLSKRYPLGHYCSYPYYRDYLIVRDVTKNCKNIHGNVFYLSVLAVFKNEATIMREWLDHHIAHGVDHFYLIDDFSSDNSPEILHPYIEKGLVDMFPPSDSDLAFRQGAMYNRVFREVYAKNETTWLAIIDLDEFLYSPQEVDVRKVLRKHEDLAVVGVNWLIFGSSGYTHQPHSVVQSFVFRAHENPTEYKELLEHYKVYNSWKANFTFQDWQKSIVNTMYRVDSVDVHHSRVEGMMENLSVKRFPNNPPLIINHYIVQSKEWFMKVKATRGDVNNVVSDSARNLKYFQMCDINAEKDTRLKDQNKEQNII